MSNLGPILKETSNPPFPGGERGRGIEVAWGASGHAGQTVALIDIES